MLSRPRPVVRATQPAQDGEQLTTESRRPGGIIALDRTREATRASTGFAYALGVAAAMLVALASRTLAFGSGDFPDGDGGMFYVMVQDLLRHHFALPAATTYNGAHIPFAYPPLGFYLIAAFHAFFRWDILSLFRVMPLTVSVLAVGAFGMLARTLLESRRAAIVATFVFALLPQSFAWEMQGGGITRSLGMLFALLTLWQVLLAWQGSRLALALAIPLAALTALSHVEWAWFTAYSLILLAAFRARNRSGIVRLAVLGTGAATLLVPWGVAVLSSHGTAPFLALLSGQSSIFPWYIGLANLAGLTLTPSVWFPFGMALGALGGAISLARRAWLLPVWLLAVVTIDGRVPLERSVIVVALLAGVGVNALLEARFLSDRSEHLRSSAHDQHHHQQQQPVRPTILAAGVGFALLWGMLNTVIWEAKNTATLSPAARSAMSWFRNNTPAGSTAVVVTSAYWGLNLDAEWFPALTGRVSLTTVQGSEWVSGAFVRRYHEDQRLQKCAFRGSACLATWMKRYHLAPDYVYVAKAAPLQLIADAAPADSDCCWSLRASLDHDPAYVRVYNGRGAAIYRRR